MLDLLGYWRSAAHGERFGYDLVFRGVSHPVDELFDANLGTKKMPGPAK